MNIFVIFLIYILSHEVGKSKIGRASANTFMVVLGENTEQFPC